MGKGNCLLGFATMGVRAIRQVMGCLCCLIIIGPLLFIVGVIMLVSPNNYAANVQKWNAAVANYTSDTVPIIKKTVLDFPSANTTISTSTVTVKPSGNSKDVTPNVQSVRWVASSYSLNRADLQVTVDSSQFAPATATATTQQFMVAGGSSSQWEVERNTVDADCNDDNGCSSSEMREKCASNVPSSHDKYNCKSSDMEMSGGTTYDGDSRTCTYYLYVASYCQPLKLNSKPNEKWVKDTSMSSCDYPFDSQMKKCSRVSSHSTTVPFTFMASNDPHIELSRITKGDLSFGLTELQQRLIGLGLIVVGAMFIACMIGLCIAMRQAFCGNNHEHKGAVYGAFGRQYEYPQGYQKMDAQPQQYNQNQQVQGGYNQQQSPLAPQSPPQGGGYPPQQGGAYGQPPPQQQAYPPQQQPGGYPPQQQGAYGQPPPPGAHGQCQPAPAPQGS
jgi:hypothetical protein